MISKRREFGGRKGLGGGFSKPTGGGSGGGGGGGREGVQIDGRRRKGIGFGTEEREANGKIERGEGMGR